MVSYELHVQEMGETQDGFDFVSNVVSSGTG